MTLNPAPPQQPNRPEGLKLETILANLWIAAEMFTTDIHKYREPNMDTPDIKQAEALTAIRTRIERATPPYQDATKTDYEYGYNAAIDDFKSNIQRELGT